MAEITAKERKSESLGSTEKDEKTDNALVLDEDPDAGLSPEERAQVVCYGTGGCEVKEWS